MISFLDGSLARYPRSRERRLAISRDVEESDHSIRVRAEKEPRDRGRARAFSLAPENGVTHFIPRFVSSRVEVPPIGNPR